MSLKYIIPNGGMEELVCSSCSNYLSIFPIYLTSDNSGVICGRCTPFNQDNFVRDEAYESIAEFLQFPCCYKKNGCLEELSPHALGVHEPTCLFRKFECPSKTYTKCEWLGVRSELVGHFEESHLDLLLKNCEFVWNLTTSNRENVLLPFEEELFIVKKDLDGRRQLFSCSVQRFGAQSDSDRYNYIIKLLSDDRSFWCKLPEKSTEDSQTVTTDGDYVKEKLHDPATVIVQIEILKADKTKVEHLEQPTEIQGNVNLDWDVLNELQCPVCYVHMSPEIYQCSGGHSICSDCKLVIKQCPLCRKDVLDTRNYGLEKLTPFLIYPCKFHTNGCTYTSKCTEIKKHEEKCEFGPLECPLKETENCQMKINRPQIVDHVEKYHKAFILKSNRIAGPFKVDETRECFYLMKFSNMVFLVRYKYANRKFYWTVQLVGSAEDCKKFKFDIDIIDNSKSKLRCYWKGFCVSIKERIDFDDPHKYIMLTYEQLQPFITTTLDYNIHITVE